MLPFFRFQVDTSASSEGEVSSSLKISSLIASDGGEFRCTAINEHSTDAAVYSLLVLGEFKQQIRPKRGKLGSK